jgi:hypothetical protein
VLRQFTAPVSLRQACRHGATVCVELTQGVLCSGERLPTYLTSDYPDGLDALFPQRVPRSRLVQTLEHAAAADCVCEIVWIGLRVRPRKQACKR